MVLEILYFKVGGFIRCEGLVGVVGERIIGRGFINNKWFGFLMRLERRRGDKVKESFIGMF